jgi:hypothetical protein
MASDVDLKFSADDRFRMDLTFDDVLPHDYAVEQDEDFEERLAKAALTWQDMLTKTETRINQQLVLHETEEASMAVRHGICHDEDRYYDLLDLLKLWRPGADAQEWSRQWDIALSPPADPVDLDSLDE